MKRVLFILGIILAAFLLFLTIAGYFYGDKVKQIIVTEISKKLNVEVTVREIHFSVFRNFPEASVELIDVKTVEKNPSFNEPLLKAGRLSLLFDLLDIISGDYTIEKVVLDNGQLHLEVLNDNQNNFTVFSNSGKAKPSSVKLNLQKVMLNGVDVYYHHQPSDQEYVFKVSSGNLKGAFSNNNFILQMDAKMFSKFIRSGDIQLLNNRELEARLIMSVDSKKGLYTLKETNIKIEGIEVSLSGTILAENDGKNLDLNIRADKAELQKLLSYIPEEYLQGIKDYSIDGEVSVKIDIKGAFSGKKTPSITSDFSLANGKITDKPSGLIFRNVFLKGTFNNGVLGTKETFNLRLYDIKAGINAGEVQGELTFNNFARPEISVTLTSSINLDKLDEIIQIEALQSITGKLDLDLKFSNTLKNLHKFTIHDFLSSKTTGRMKISDVGLKLKDSPVNYHHLNGTFKFNNKDLLIENFNGNINESDFKMTGYFLNMMAFALVPGEQIRIKADFSSSNLDMDDLLSIRKDKAGSTYRMKFSDRVNFDLDLVINKFTFGTFKGENIRGNAVMKDNKLTISNASFNSMEGTTLLNGFIDGNYPDKFWVSFRADLKEVNIQQFFFQLGEFGQKNITSNELRGTVDATIYYKSFVDDGLNIDPGSVYVLGDIVISKGELIRYTPLHKLSKYIKQKELEHITFSTLKNQIEIKDRVVYVPEMDIESNTLDLKIFGSHNFDNVIDYHVRVLLSQLLSKKDKPKEEEIEGIFTEEDGLGRTTLFLHMTGNAQDPDIKYDTKEVRKKLSSDMTREKQELKDAFNREFSNKENAQQSGADDLNKNLPDAGKDFKIEWEEDPPDTTKKTGLPSKQKTEPDKKTRKKEFIIEWDEEKDTLR